MMLSNLWYGISILIVMAVFLSGCTEQQSDVSREEESVTPTEPPVFFGVWLSSLSCDWTVKMDQYGNKNDCVRMISQGTAQGPIGVRIELPILSWSDDIFDCGAWTHKTGALIAVSHTCVREAGQPEIINWTVDTGGDDCPLKSYFTGERLYGVKIYNDSDLTPQKEDEKTTLCQ